MSGGLPCRACLHLHCLPRVAFSPCVLEQRRREQAAREALAPCLPQAVRARRGSSASCDALLEKEARVPSQRCRGPPHPSLLLPAPPSLSRAHRPYVWTHGVFSPGPVRLKQKWGDCSGHSFWCHAPPRPRVNVTWRAQVGGAAAVGGGQVGGVSRVTGRLGPPSLLLGFYQGRHCCPLPWRHVLSHSVTPSRAVAEVRSGRVCPSAAA